MKMVYKNGNAALSCDLTPAVNFYLKTKNPTRYKNDVLSYATCQFLRKSEAACRKCTWESYQLRLASGKGRNPRMHWMAVPARDLGLAGEWIRVEMLVSATGVTVTGIGFYATKADARAPGHPGARS